ncbi:hypothetical protein [Chryseosolibacter indicus]|uniref:Uncharacterized protein n=1 Tax=Chryseosolibacter indicus TaxID=2782351 RepID=A0ABS5W0N8_9BACT|nr:hypothetical protein [Chryseosolibacter indicus]MBT1706534.1 hypothetical protein [Chryseosolibacter indicus]
MNQHHLKFKLAILLSVLTFNVYSQHSYTICKVDSSSSRVFVHTTRQYLNNLDNVKEVVRHIESKYSYFKDLEISFFDDKTNCGYQAEEVKITTDSLVDITIKNVRAHWFAEYNSKKKKIKYFRDDGSMAVKHFYYLKNE